MGVLVQRGIAEVRHMMFGPAPSCSSPLSPGIEHQTRSWSARLSSRSGKAPWDPNSDSESDDGRRDTSHFTEDGKHVIQKQYKLINGHYALIAYRLELNEVDPYLLLKLREKRERELARLEVKKKKREGKRRARNGESNNNIGKNEEDSKLYHKTFTREEEKAIEKWRAPHTSTPGAQLREKTSQSSSSRPSSRGRGSRGITAREQGTGKAPQEPKERIRGERCETRTPAGNPEMRKTHKHESPASLHSFRARAEQDYFRATPQWGVGDEEYEEGPVQAESSKAPAARLALRRTKGRTWMERFAEDITYASTDSSSDTDSVVTVIKAPARQPGDTKGKAPDYGKSRHRSRVVKEEEDLDIWHKIADEE